MYIPKKRLITVNLHWLYPCEKREECGPLLIRAEIGHNNKSLTLFPLRIIAVIARLYRKLKIKLLFLRIKLTYRDEDYRWKDAADSDHYIEVAKQLRKRK